MFTIKEQLSQICTNTITKIVLSKPNQKNAPFRKIELDQKESAYLAAKYTNKQVFHEKVSAEELPVYCTKALTSEFLQLNAWDSSFEHILLLSQKGKLSYKKKTLSTDQLPKISPTHNREKQYLIPEGTIVPPLIDMGIFTKEGKVVQSMYDKFRQINRFIEMIDDTIKKSPPKSLNIIDFGCGKSYLTFILYYYFTEIRQIPVQMLGLDLKADVIEKCNQAAARYGYEGLRFELGDINGYQCTFPVDMVISLHACDTATDYALYNAVCWNAKMIFSVPCCQHELNGQIESETLSLLTRYGIVKERVAALATDAIRGRLLEACGYKVQLLEFVDLSHTAKNILIRAVKGKADKAAITEVNALCDEFKLKPTLYTLLQEKLEG